MTPLENLLTEFLQAESASLPEPVAPCPESRKIESIVSAKIAGEPLPRAIADWIASASDDLRAKLADAGLCEERKSAGLCEFIEAEIAGRNDAAPNTVRNWQNTLGKLRDYFGDHNLRSISSGDARTGGKGWSIASIPPRRYPRP